MTEEQRAIKDMENFTLTEDFEDIFLYSGRQSFRTVLHLAKRDGLEREELRMLLISEVAKLVTEWKKRETGSDCNDLLNNLTDAICTRFCSPEFPEEKVRQTIVQVGKTYEEIIQALKNLWEGI